MLEEVARARRATALVEQLVDHQLTETALQHPFLDPGQRASQDIGVAAGFEHPRTENGLGQLLDIERHAVGLGDDMIDHLAG